MQQLIHNISAVVFGLTLLLRGASADVPDFGFQATPKRVAPVSRTAPDVGRGDLFIPDRQKTQALKQARRLIGNSKYVSALKILQTILDLRGDSLFYDNIEDKTNFLSLKTEAARLIGSLPGAGRDAYELRFGAIAERRLRDAITAGNLRNIQEIASRYFHTRAGYKATYLLASSEMDSGHFLTAAFQFDRLRRLPKSERSLDLEPMLSLRTAVCWGRAGMAQFAVNALVELRRQVGDKVMTIGGRRVKFFTRDDEARRWYVSVLGERQRFEMRRVKDWMMLRGNPSRTGGGNKATPEWSASWSAGTVKDAMAMDDPSLPLLNNVQKRLVEMETRRKSTGYHILPAAHPLVVGGLVISRSVRNLYAFDLKTGKLKWKSASDSSFFRDFLSQATNANPSSSSTLDMLLTQRAWSDLTAGTLSSDGRFVYSIEDVGYVNTTVRRSSRSPNSEGMHPFNTLTAVELSTGKLIWQVGGSLQPDLPLTDTFFLGPPLPMGGRLFCLAELKGEIRILAIDTDHKDDPQPKLLWSQPLIHTEADVGRVGMRRMAGISPSYAGGVLVCPTAAGAVVAVDPARKQLLWGYRYRSKAQAPAVRSNRGRVVRYRVKAPGKDRWIDAAATIVGKRVVLTPRDSDELHCVSLINGSLLWKQQRNDGLFVAAVHKGKVIIVGRNEIRAVGLRDGKPAWKQPTRIPAPSGRGFQTQQLYYLPLSTGEVAAVDLNSGRLVSQSKTKSGRVLGNLVPAHGAIVSQSYDAVVRFKSLPGKSGR